MPHLARQNREEVLQAVEIHLPSRWRASLSVLHRRRKRQPTEGVVDLDGVEHRWVNCGDGVSLVDSLLSQWRPPRGISGSDKKKVAVDLLKLRAGAKGVPVSGQVGDSALTKLRQTS